jgi:hypothetical protein
MGDAVADALREDRAAGAESAAVRAQAEASRVRGELHTQEKRATSFSRDAQMCAKDLEKALAESTALASAGLIVINAMIKTMETMKPDQREKFREQVAQLARARMQKLDTDRVHGDHHVSIEHTFAAREQSKLLGIV